LNAYVNAAYCGAKPESQANPPPKPLLMALDPHCWAMTLGSGRAGMGAVACGGLQYWLDVLNGWLKDGVGDGSCMSLRPKVLQNVGWGSLQVVMVGLGVDGTTLQDSTGAGCGCET
jgi:hypothetical protein